MSWLEDGDCTTRWCRRRSWIGKSSSWKGSVFTVHIDRELSTKVRRVIWLRAWKLLQYVKD